MQNISALLTMQEYTLRYEASPVIRKSFSVCLSNFDGFFREIALHLH